MAKSRQGMNATRHAAEKSLKRKESLRKQLGQTGVFVQRFLLVILVVSCLGALFVGAGFLYQKDGGLSLRSIQISGNDYLNQEFILQKLGVETGTFVQDVDSDSLELLLEKNPWIAKASLGWLDTRTLDVQIEEHLPLAYLQKEKNGLVLSSGNWVQPDNRVYDLPIIINNKHLNLQEAADVLNSLQKESPNDFSSLIELEALGNGEYELQFSSLAGLVRYSTSNSLLEGMRRIKTLKQSHFTEVAMAKEIDIRFGGFVYLR